MTFYTYAFLENSIGLQNYLKYLLIFISLGALFFATTLYLRHRLETKYRDLSIIFLLLIIFLSGVQYIQYQQNKNYADDTSRMVTFLNSLQQAQNIAISDLKVNSRSLTNGMIVAFEDKFFEVHFSHDLGAYSLAPIHLVNPNIQIIDKERD